jgi:hypothetical protein
MLHVSDTVTFMNVTREKIGKTEECRQSEAIAWAGHTNNVVLRNELPPSIEPTCPDISRR